MANYRRQDCRLREYKLYTYQLTTLAFFLEFTIFENTHSIIKIGGGEKEGIISRRANSCKGDSARSLSLTLHQIITAWSVFFQYLDQSQVTGDTHGPQKPDVILAEKQLLVAQEGHTAQCQNFISGISLYSPNCDQEGEIERWFTLSGYVTWLSFYSVFYYFFHTRGKVNTKKLMVCFSDSEIQEKAQRKDLGVRMY